MEKKIGEDGRRKGGRRVGNFVVTEGRGCFAVRDVGGLVSFRVGRGTGLGNVMPVLLSDAPGAERMLGLELAVVELFLCAVPDWRMLAEVAEAVRSSVARHAEDFYGVRPGIPAADDAAILADVREGAELRERAGMGEGQAGKG